MNSKSSDASDTELDMVTARSSRLQSLVRVPKILVLVPCNVDKDWCFEVGKQRVLLLARNLCFHIRSGLKICQNNNGSVSCRINLSYLLI